MAKFTHTVYAPGYVHIGPEQFAYWVETMQKVRAHLDALHDQLRGSNLNYATDFGCALGHTRAMCNIMSGELQNAKERDTAKEDVEPTF